MLSLNLQEGYTLVVVTAGVSILGIISGIVGSLAMLKKQSLLADTVSHACLPGIVLAFILTGHKTHSVLLAGAAAVGWLAAFQIYMLVNKERLKQDSLMSLTLSVYFGFGMVLLSYIQHKPGAGQTGIETFLFGQAATMLLSDLKIMAVVGIVIILLLVIFKKELIMVIFDPLYTASLGYSIYILEFLFSLILVCSVVIGLQAVGIVLMSSMLVGPAVAARQWTNNLTLMTLIAAFFGCISGIGGTIASSLAPDLPTGPLIIICISIIALLSIIAAPKRGLYWRKRINNVKYIDIEQKDLLHALYTLSVQKIKNDKGYTQTALQYLFPYKKNVDIALKSLKNEGFVKISENKYWNITGAGIEKINKILNQAAK